MRIGKMEGVLPRAVQCRQLIQVSLGAEEAQIYSHAVLSPRWLIEPSARMVVWSGHLSMFLAAFAC